MYYETNSCNNIMNGIINSTRIFMHVRIAYLGIQAFLQADDFR